VKVDGRNNINLFSPPLLNLKKSPGLPKIALEGKNLQYSISNTAMRRFVEWSVKDGESEWPENPVLNFRFRNIPNRSLQVNRVTPFPEGSRVLTAIQKNNEIRWIRDWFRHYEERFGVDYLVLYDNGSDDFAQLRDELPENTVLVDWRFPYGPTFSHDNKFTQLGALNHCRRVFGSMSYIFNFDIDELLFLKSGTIDGILDGRRVIYFSSYNVPNRKNLPENYSFASYTERQTRPRYSARKYVFFAPSSTGALPHYVQTQRFAPYAYLVLIMRKVRNTLLRKTRDHKAFRVRFTSLLLRLSTSNLKEPSMSVDTAYFLHFLGITTHWKDLNYRKTPQKNCIEDPLLMELQGESR
jgi:hypothetical protein